MTMQKAQNYDSKNSKAADGTRMLKVLFKNTEKVKAPMPSKFISAAPIAGSELQEVLQNPRFAPHALSILHNAQMELVRARLLAEGEGCMIDDSDYSVAKCLDYLDEEAKGNRLSKESITAWFQSDVADMLTVAIADKLGLPDTPSDVESSKVAAMVADYSSKFAGLAGSKTVYSPEIAQKLVRALEVAGADSEGLGLQFKSKLLGMKEKPVADLLGL